MVANKKSKAGSSRGGIAKRRGARPDKDGDVAMDSSSRGGRGGISKSKSASGGTRDGTTKPARKSINTTRLQREVQNHVSSGPSVRAPREPEDLVITGWNNSTATSSTDSVVNSLIAWLEKRATLKSPTKRPVKVKKSRVEDQELIITVPGENVGAILRLNGFVFAGNNISVAKVKADPADPNSKENIIAMFTAFLARRYNPETKLLDLSALGSDPELKASQVFESASTTSKVFPALMKVLDRQFDTPALKHEAIQSVTLANNELSNITAVTTLAPTLPQLKNLDLSNNKIAKIADLGLWRTKFPNLEHLIVSNNPIETEEPNYATTLIMWYSKLRLLNTVQVRTEEEVAKASQVTDFPFPIRTPSFQDEGQVAENFIRTFFNGFDSDRPALAAHFYDEHSDFSYAVNTSAPRDPSGEGATGPQEWGDYIKQSRNLKKISHLPARQNRLYKGTEAVAAAFATIPPTRHPDLAVEPKKWLIECQLQPGVPDPSGQSPGGVDGFLINIHSEYEDLESSTGQTKKKRSFDRTFIIGPGGPAGVRIVNDMLTVRAYGGIAAFEPEQPTIADPAPAAIAPQLPNGLTTEVAEQMILKLQELTRMTIGYAKDCLEQVGWDFDKAQQAFESVKAGLPAEAFIQA